MTFLICDTLTILLSTPVAFFACLGRGYLSALGFVVSAIVLAQIIAVTGYGHYFPWAVPALYSKITGSISPPLEPISYILVVLTSILGLTGTLLWWRYADHV